MSQFPGMLIVPGAPRGVPRFPRSVGANFGGTTYLTRGAALTGAADSKICTGSMWLKKGGSDGVVEDIFNGTSTFVRVAKTAGNRLQVTGRNAASTSVLSISTSALITVANGWQHIVYSVDLADPAKCHLYRNGISDLSVTTTFTDDTISFTSLTDIAFGANTAGGAPLTGDMADLALWPGQYIDLSIAINLRKFISALGKPVFFGLDGCRPGLGRPIVYLRGMASQWHANKGTGGGMTVTAGALTPSTTAPSL